MDRTPDISVIMPVYNGAATLGKSIQSVLVQSYTNFELIIVDDGSTDNSLEFLKVYEETDRRVRVVSQENRGVSAARNTGIKVSRGKYITFLDCDDRYKPEYLQTMLSAITESQTDVVICGYVYVESGHKVMLRDRCYHGWGEFANDLEQLISSNCLGFPWNKIYERKSIHYGFPEDIQLGEDLIFNIKNLKECRSARTISDCLYEYSISSDMSLSRKYDIRMLDTFSRIKKEVEACAGKQWCMEHELFIVNWTWNAWLRNSLRLCISDALSYREKRKIFNSWKDHELSMYIRENQKKIKKHRILLKTQCFAIWYMIIRGWDLAERLRRVKRA